MISKKNNKFYTISKDEIPKYNIEKKISNLKKSELKDFLSYFFFLTIYKKINFVYYLHGANFGIFKYSSTPYLMTSGTVNLKHKFINILIKKRSITNFIVYKMTFNTIFNNKQKYEKLNRFFYLLYLNSSLIFNVGYDVTTLCDVDDAYGKPTYVSLVTNDSISVRHNSQNLLKYFGLNLFYLLNKKKTFFYI